MQRGYEPYIPDGRFELSDKLAAMMLDAPDFEDDSGFFPGKSMATQFFALNEGLSRIRADLGEELYGQLSEMAAEMERLFKADPTDETGETQRGREMINEMRALLEE